MIGMDTTKSYVLRMATWIQCELAVALARSTRK